MLKESRVTLFGKERVLREWVEGKLGNADHEVRVAGVASRMFELTRGWHGLGTQEQRLLMLGALVHDVGRAVDDDGHEKHGARMILRNSSLPLSDAERRRIAYLTRYHRGPIAAPGTEDILQQGRNGDDLQAMRILAGLLRAADGLDKRSMDPPTLVMRVRDRRLLVRGYVQDRAAAAATLGKSKKFRLLEETLDCAVETEWMERGARVLAA